MDHDLLSLAIKRIIEDAMATPVDRHLGAVSPHIARWREELLQRPIVLPQVAAVEPPAEETGLQKLSRLARAAAWGAVGWVPGLRLPEPQTTGEKIAAALSALGVAGIPLGVLGLAVRPVLTVRRAVAATPTVARVAAPPAAEAEQGAALLAQLLAGLARPEGVVRRIRL